MAKNKTEQELRVELEMKARQTFLAECNEALQPIFDKHMMQLVPVINNYSNQHKVHYEAAFAVQRFTKEEVKVQKGNATLGTQPETIEQSDSNNQTPKE